ncbi:hypothetical protein Tco_1134577 [Tanacetum coccineum]
MCSYNYSNLDKLRWLAKTLKKGLLFAPNSDEPPLRSYQLWKKTFYEEAYKIDYMIELPKSPPKKTYEEDLESEIVMVKIPRCMAWLGSSNAYDDPIDSIGMMENEVGNTSPQDTSQILPSFEEYTPPVTYPKEVEGTVGIPMEVEPLDHTKLEDLDLNTCSHDLFLSSREIPSVGEPEPQLLPNFSPLNVNLGDKRGTESPIKPHSLDTFRMKVVDKSTINTTPLPHVASFHPKDMYCYYYPCIDDPKKHYRFKSGLLGQSGSLGVNFSNIEMI